MHLSIFGFLVSVLFACVFCSSIYFTGLGILVGWFGLEPISRLTRSFFSYLLRKLWFHSHVARARSLSSRDGVSTGSPPVARKVDNPKVTIFHADF